MNRSRDVPTSDAFGAMCLDFHETGEAHEVIERDDGFVDVTGGPNIYFESPAEWNSLDHTAVEWAHGRVLDIGCGPGRHALELQRRGHDVTGIDVSPGAVAVARDRGVEDVRELGVNTVEELDDRYDSVVMLGLNFGLVGTAERVPSVLDGLATVTTADAALIASSMDPTETDDQAHLDYHQRNRDRGRLPGALRLRTRYRRYVGDWFDYLHVAPETMRELVGPTAWSVATVKRGDHSYVAKLQKT